MKVYERMQKNQINSSEFVYPSRLHRASFELLQTLPEDELPDPAGFDNSKRHAIIAVEFDDGKLYRLVGGTWLPATWT